MGGKTLKFVNCVRGPARDAKTVRPWKRSSSILACVTHTVIVWRRSRPREPTYGDSPPRRSNPRSRRRRATEPVPHRRVSDVQGRALRHTYAANTGQEGRGSTTAFWPGLRTSFRQGGAEVADRRVKEHPIAPPTSWPSLPTSRPSSLRLSTVVDAFAGGCAHMARQTSWHQRCCSAATRCAAPRCLLGGDAVNGAWSTAPMPACWMERRRRPPSAPSRTSSRSAASTRWRPTYMACSTHRPGHEHRRRPCIYRTSRFAPISTRANLQGRDNSGTRTMTRATA